MQGDWWAGDRVCLRAGRPDDLDIFLREAHDTDACRLSGDVEFPPCSSRKRRWLERILKGERDNELTLIVLADAATGEAVGSAMTFRFDRQHGTFWMGLSILREHWGRGYAREAIPAILRHHFVTLGFHKCQLGVYEYNPRAIRLYERLGFAHEGRLRQNHRTAGRRWDELIMGLTAEEFLAKHGG